MITFENVPNFLSPIASIAHLINLTITNEPAEKITTDNRYTNKIRRTLAFSSTAYESAKMPNPIAKTATSEIQILFHNGVSVVRLFDESIFNL